jgi:KUP system potassium uptake protein
MSATVKVGAVSQVGTARAWAPAALACMGVVFGDIGTSPLYTLNVAANLRVWPDRFHRKLC